MKYFSIAIDGPAGAGKSTIAKQIAKQLGYIYIDTGAMYRAITLYFLNNGITVEDDLKIEEACEKVSITISFIHHEQQVLLNGENVNGKIRTEEVSAFASSFSAKPAVRKKLVELQKKIAEKENVVMDGRDIGTHVLPNADLKIYLTASTHIRAIRRYEELIARGEACVKEEIEKEIKIRDERDMNRECSPLVQAEDAVLIDSSELSIDQVTNKIIKRFIDRTGAKQ